MAKSLIVYFSIGGTTARVADSIALGLRAAKYQVDLHKMQDGQAPDPGAYDLIGIGTPAHFFRPALNVMDYVNGLPDLEGLSAFVFVLHGTYLGDTGNFIRRALTRKGARDVGYFQCRGADYFMGYLREGYLFSPDHPTAEELTQAEQFGRRVAARVAGQEYTGRHDDPAPALVYRLERFLVNRWLTRQVYSRLFRVNRQKCTACDLCMKQCPTGNITEDKGGAPVWGRNCLLCLNCEMRCPQDAIASPADWPLMRLLMTYNVRRASRDSTLDHVRIRHSQGRTERV